MHALRYVVTEHPRNHRVRYDDLSAALIAVPVDPATGETPDGVQSAFVVLAWHKDRGKVESAFVVWPGGTPEPLTLKTAEWLIADAERDGAPISLSFADIAD
jgi:hypothetical protein